MYSVVCYTENECHVMAVDLETKEDGFQWITNEVDNDERYYVAKTSHLLKLPPERVVTYNRVFEEADSAELQNKRN